MAQLGDTSMKTYVRQRCYNLPIQTAKQRLVRERATEAQIEMELDRMVKNMPVEEELCLKKGAQVMCVRNIPESRLYNGSQGLVVGFDPMTGYPMVRFLTTASSPPIMMAPLTWESSSIPGIGWTQVPLQLSWAMTIHKAQGATMDLIEVDVGRSIFEFGQTYVALSRVKTLDGLYLTAFDANLVKSNGKVSAFYATLQQPPLQQQQQPPQQTMDNTNTITNVATMVSIPTAIAVPMPLDRSLPVAEAVPVSRDDDPDIRHVVLRPNPFSAYRM
jgi:hypothetical protein